ncbi:MAG TPA: glycoside hydrolase family 15 protein [Vicinamibacterales bacterium]|nr:glycoside hydrolase family 15 protein [Vicinamibacterales bacterium]
MSKSPAPGGPGLPPRWTRGAKEAVGTAYTTASRVWYTIAAGILTEVFYPTIDTPQIRDLQFLITDGAAFFHDERRDTVSTVTCVDEAALGFDIVNTARDGRYTLRKTLIGAPHYDCVLMRTAIEAAPDVLRTLQLYVLCAPHLDIGGWHNNAETLDTKGGPIIVAFKNQTFMALGCTAPFLRRSCGYVAVNDGWTDLHDNKRMDWEYDGAYDGNIAVTAQINPAEGPFTVGLAFGDTRHRAIANLFQALAVPFAESLTHFNAEWKRTSKRFALVSRPSGPSGPSSPLLFERSVNLLLAHEDKSYPGAIIASTSIPWGASKGDEELGGYHLVWTRDLVQSATALLAAGDTVTPVRALIYLAISQRADGGFYQNFWIDGRPYWTGTQLDEVSFPVVLAWRLYRANALRFNPATMVAAACGFLIREGPWSPQERWEEAAGFSPSTLAVTIAALICGADLLDIAGRRADAEFIRDHADFLEAHIDRWTATTAGTLVPGVARHYIRVNPNVATEDPDAGDLVLANQPPGGPYAYPAREVVDAGFLELVRYGIRDAHDPLVVQSVRVVDAVLKVDTPGGPCWRRYNHDGYGQRADGSSFKGWGVGRPWPLLTGERGHYELAAERDALPFARALEAFAVGVGLIPEQIWDQPAIADKLLTRGGPTGAALPLLWAHAEYIKLVRSIADGRVFDRIEPVANRYLGARRPPARLEVWSAKRPIASVPSGTRLRVVAGEPFTIEWSSGTVSSSTDTGLGVSYVEVDLSGDVRFRLRSADRSRELIHGEQAIHAVC